jgi:hypothetical protein
VTFVQCINYVAALFAFAAAALWFKSASIKAPTSFFIATEISQSSFDGSIGGSSFSADLTDLGEALKQQSRWSGYAAICAAIAAIFSGLALAIGAASN